MERFSHRFRCTNVGHWWGLAWSLLSPVFRDDHVFQMLLKQWLMCQNTSPNSKGLRWINPFSAGMFGLRFRLIEFMNLLLRKGKTSMPQWRRRKKKKKKKKRKINAHCEDDNYSSWFVVWNMFYFPFHMGCHPSHWLSLYHIFQDGAIAPPTSIYDS